MTSDLSYTPSEQVWYLLIVIALVIGLTLITGTSVLICWIRGTCARIGNLLPSTWREKARSNSRNAREAAIRRREARAQKGVNKYIQGASKLLIESPESVPMDDLTAIVELCQQVAHTAKSRDPGLNKGKESEALPGTSQQSRQTFGDGSSRRVSIQVPERDPDEEDSQE